MALFLFYVYFILVQLEQKYLGSHDPRGGKLREKTYFFILKDIDFEQIIPGAMLET